MRIPCILLFLSILSACRLKQDEIKNNHYTNNESPTVHKETAETTYSYRSTLIDVDPIEHDTTNDIPFVGKYIVDKYLPLDVMSQIGSGEAKKYIGRYIEYRKGIKIFDSSVCNFDSVKVQRFSDDDFQEYTRGSGSAPVSFEDLEYYGDSQVIAHYEIRYCGFGADVIYFDPENIRIDYQGSYFKLKKVKLSNVFIRTQPNHFKKERSNK